MSARPQVFLCQNSRVVQVCISTLTIHPLHLFSPGKNDAMKRDLYLPERCQFPLLRKHVMTGNCFFSFQW